MCSISLSLSRVVGLGRAWCFFLYFLCIPLSLSSRVPNKSAQRGELHLPVGGGGAEKRRKSSGMCMFRLDFVLCDFRISNACCMMYEKYITCSIYCVCVRRGITILSHMPNSSTFSHVGCRWLVSRNTSRGRSRGNSGTGVRSAARAWRT